MSAVAVQAHDDKHLQAHVHNGLDAHRKAGRFFGSYDLKIAADPEKPAGIPGRDHSSTAGAAGLTR